MNDDNDDNDDNVSVNNLNENMLEYVYTEYLVTIFCGPSSLVPSKVATDAGCCSNIVKL
jgi:hypothetical protein